MRRFLIRAFPVQNEPSGQQVLPRRLYAALSAGPNGHIVSVRMRRERNKLERNRRSRKCSRIALEITTNLKLAFVAGFFYDEIRVAVWRDRHLQLP